MGTLIVGPGGTEAAVARAAAAGGAAAGGVAEGGGRLRPRIHDRQLGENI